MLVSLILALCDHTRRLMSRSNRGVGLVNMLASCTRCTISVNTYVLFVYVESGGHLWHDYNSRCGRMHAALFLSLGDALDFMHAHFMLEVLVDILP